MDNDTVVEVFKYLNYCQLAKSSLVSKWFCDLMTTDIPWHFYPYHSQPYSRQDVSYFSNSAVFDTIDVFNARVELNHETWPLFQHCAHLLADPFIYIDSAELTLQIETLSLMDGAMSQDHNRLHCNELTVNLKGDFQKLISWMKDHVLCSEINVFKEIDYSTHEYSDLNHDKVLFDFIVSGANCTSEIKVTYYDLSKVIVDIVQKFVDLKSCDEFQVVESIWGSVSCRSAEELKRDYANLLVKEEQRESDGSIEQVFEVGNYDIEKDLQLTITRLSHFSVFSLQIRNLY
ncbi:hypothetical protein Ddc_18849 [Ditylenchus destructor]|nr:hypothetical protein Ddc_18849 [Ditylenchus destructor]